MSTKSYAMHVWVILGSSTALMLFMFVLVAHHGDVPDRVRMDRGTLLRTGSSAAERIKPVAEVNVASVETRQEPAKNAKAALPSSRDGQQVYQAGCVACHSAGIAGAPKLGDKNQWAKHISKGMDTLYASAVNGVQGSVGVMPPKGGNPSLSDAEVKAAVDYMVARSK